MHHLERHGGVWVGTNGFRLMPSDPLHDAPMSASISRAANGELAQIAYTWAHPEDGDQDGLLVLGRGEAPNAVTAFWGDSWHQSPGPRTLEGTLEGGVVTVDANYGGDWRWEIVVDAATPDRLTLTMNNVIPRSAATGGKAAGPYAAMNAVLRRA